MEQTAQIHKGMFTSRTDEWATPRSVFEDLSKKYGPFDLDPCATPENAKCDRFYTIEDDGLSRDWEGRVFMNPPFGRAIASWVAKAFTESTKGCTVVCLLPSRTDTRWFHNYCLMFGDITFLQGRLKYNDGKGRSPFPSMIVVFRPLGKHLLEEEALPEGSHSNDT